MAIRTLLSYLKFTPSKHKKGLSADTITVVDLGADVLRKAYDGGSLWSGTRADWSIRLDQD